MEDQSPHPIPPELKALMDAEIAVDGLESPAVQQRLRSLLENLPGVEAVGFLKRRVAIRYDAERTVSARLCEVLRQAGFEFSGVETAAMSPTIGMLQE